MAETVSVIRTNIIIFGKIISVINWRIGDLIMEYFYAVMLFLGGIGAFLVGCNLLSDAIKSLANKKIRNLLNKTSKSKIVSCGIGAIVTAAVQSSGLTTVMIVGLVKLVVLNPKRFSILPVYVSGCSRTYWLLYPSLCSSLIG